MPTFRKMLGAKIHRAVVTDADLDYEGSLTIPPELLALANIREFESVHVWNVTQGTRFETYAIRGEEGSNAICVNGAAAHLADPGDRIIIATYVTVPEDQVATHTPTVVFVDDRNRPVLKGEEIPGPRRRDNNS